MSETDSKQPHASQELLADRAALIARGRLSEARKWFGHLGWDALPQGIRGRRILRWGADHAGLASPTNPERSVRRWCHRWAPWLSRTDLDNIVSETRKSNKRWSADQCAGVLEITMRDRSSLALRFIGADDDPTYEIRLGIKRSKARERARKYRASRKSGRPRGRPKTIPAWKLAGYNSKRTYQRHKVLGTLGAQNGTKNASRHLNKNRKRDGIKVPHLSHDLRAIWLTMPPPGLRRLIHITSGISIALGKIESMRSTRNGTMTRGRPRAPKAPRGKSRPQC